jgi:hypothetical protein
VYFAQTEKTVVDDPQGTRFYEAPYELKMGRAQAAAWGLEVRMCVDQAVFHGRLAKGADSLEEEAAEFAMGMPADVAELRELVDYVVNQTTSEKTYANGVRDEGRGSLDPEHFVTHPNAQNAMLKKVEVCSLRLYTTPAFKHMNYPLRDDDRYSRGETVPLPVASYWANSALRKLRVGSMGKKSVVVWRGMRNRYVAKEFMTQGGTELAFMSTTTDLRVAVRYSLSRYSLLLRIVAPNFLALGADLQWLSAFPSEAEVLFPPLTFLQPTGRTDSVNALDRDGRQVTFTIIEVTASI